MADSLLHVGMEGSRLQLATDVCEKNYNLLLGPSKYTGEQSQSKSFQTVQDLHQVDHAQFLVVGVFRPVPNRNLELLVGDIDVVASLPDPVLQLRSGVGLAVDAFARIKEQLRPLASLVLFGVTTVI